MGSSFRVRARVRVRVSVSVSVRVTSWVRVKARVTSLKQETQVL